MVFTAAAPRAESTTTAALNCQALRGLISGRLAGLSSTGTDMHIQVRIEDNKGRSGGNERSSLSVVCCLLEC